MKLDDTDQEIAHALNAVKRHQWKARLSMGAAMLIGGPFIALGLIYSPLGLVLWIPGIALGGVVWKALRPKSSNPLDGI